MKHNHSLKELYLSKIQSKEQDGSTTIYSPREINPSPTVHMKGSHTNLLRHAKNNHSQKNLFQLHTFGSPKYAMPARDRCNTARNILTPANKNLSSQEQPKKPRILSKVRQSASFNDEFKMGKVLGKGRFGNVCMAVHNATGSIFAVKKISLEKASSKLIERLIAEIKIQFFVKHENCLQLYKFYKENKNFYLILELGESSLFDILRKKRFFTERDTAYYIRQTISALKHLHENGVIHRDLKPENIVLVNNKVKLADFGWAIYTGRTNKRTTFCGTLDYVSPEIVMGSEYDEMVDAWSIGVLCYELCTGHAPFESSKSRQETYRKILNIDIKFPRHLSEGVQDFICKLLVRKPQARMSLEDALNHPWLKKYE